jgi:hypothetical protein
MSKSTTKWTNKNNSLVLETKLQEPKEDVLIEQLNFEIECPRCSDIMELCSEFDYLSYYCGSCQLKMNVC